MDQGQASPQASAKAGSRRNIRVVQGHQPKAYDIKYRIGAIDEGRFVKLDNGMAPGSGAHLGSLLRIGTPIEMGEMKTPRLQVIGADGKTHPLVID